MPKHPALSPDRVQEFLEALFADDLHVKRIRSLADATVGALHAGELGIHAIGRGLAVARGLLDKHAVKQVDRLFGNAGVDPWELFASWVPHVLAGRREVIVNLDWTEFEADDHSTLVLSMQTDHGRSTPLVWQTVVRSELGEQRNDHEDRLLRRFKDVLPAGVQVTIVADRGFADQKLYRFLREELGFGYIIRFRSCIRVTSSSGETRTAKEWVGRGGKMCVLRNAAVTADMQPVPTVVCVQEPGMADAWCIVASDETAAGKDLVRRYGRRFSIEEMFRDIKDLRFGMGLGWRKVYSPPRRDRLLLVAALAQSLLTILGQAGERAGLDRLLKTNTAKKRTLSLFRQGLLWYERIPTMPADRLRILIAAFTSCMLEYPVFKQALGYK